MAVSADTPEQAEALRTGQGLTFPIVSDTDLAIAAAWGLRQEGKDAALPATYVLDDQGRVVFARVGTDPVNRPTPEHILAALGDA